MKWYKTIPLLIGLVSSVLAQQTNIQQEDSLSLKFPTYQAEPVIVTATRTRKPALKTPYAINQLNRHEIREGEKLISLETALQPIPGLFVNNRQNFALGDRISMRGIGARASFGVRGIKIIVDGIPLTMPDGQTQLSNLDLASAGEIEVLRGPSASLYGNGAGGLIRIQTETATDRTFTFEPQLTTGSNGLLRLQGKISGSLGFHNYLLNVNHVQSDGYRGHSAAKFWKLNGVGRHNLSKKMHLTTVINYYNAPYLLNPSSLTKTDALKNPTKSRFFVRQQGAGEQIDQVQGGITFRYTPGKQQEFKVTAYAITRNLLNPIPGRIIELDRTAVGLRTSWHRQDSLGNFPLEWTIGTDIEIQNDNRSEYENMGIPSDKLQNLEGEAILNAIQYGRSLLQQEENVLGIGPFIHTDWLLHPKWRLTLGGRFDSYRFKINDQFREDGSDDSGTITMQQFSPMAGLVFEISSNRFWYLNFTTAFQTPTTTELSNRPDGSGGLNPNLQPVDIISYELGVKRIIPDWEIQYQAAVYFMQLNDMLIPFQSSEAEQEEIFYRNAGRSQNTGAELFLNWSPSRHLDIDLSYTHMDFKFEDYQVLHTQNNQHEFINLTGNQIPGVPKQRFYMGIKYSHISEAFVKIQFNWVDEYFANDFNGPPPDNDKPQSNYINDAYSTIDIRLGKYWHLSNTGIKFFLGVDNLLDERYNSSIIPNAFGARFFEPAPGQTWYGGVSLMIPK